MEAIIGINEIIHITEKAVLVGFFYNSRNGAAVRETWLPKKSCTFLVNARYGGQGLYAAIPFWFAKQNRLEILGSETATFAKIPTDSLEVKIY